MPEPPSSLAGEGRNGGPRVPARVSRGQGHRRELPRARESPRLLGFWGVDPHGLGARLRPGEAGGEAFRVDGIGRGEHGRPCGDALLGQAKVHVVRGEQAQAAVMMGDVLPFIEQGRVDFGRGEIPEPRLVQHREHRGLFSGAQGAWRRGPGLGDRPGAPTPVVRGPRQAQRRAGWCDAELGAEVRHGRHQDFSESSGVPSNAASFFWTSIRASARSARFRHRIVSRSSSAIFLSRGSDPCGAGPRFL